MAQQDNWQVFVTRAHTLGGRFLRHQLVWEGQFYHIWEGAETASSQEGGEGRRGLLLPFVELTAENAGIYLPKMALALQQARGFQRVVLMLGEPLPEALALLQRHQEKGLPCTAVCAGRGELYGWELPEEPMTLVEELLETFRGRVESSSPRKRLILPYRETEKRTLLHVGDLASAALFALSKDEDTTPLLVEGVPFAYGTLAAAAARAAGFEGKVQYGKEKLPKAQPADKSNLRVMQGQQPYSLEDTLPYLWRTRARKGSFTISACVIMRDSEEDIGRCLASLQEMDEIIVVDTGSVDRSVEIARGYTDKIYHFEWINDFAAAKNFALDKAQGDWIVFLDSDEFFTEETKGNVRRAAMDYDGLLGLPRQLLLRRMELNKDLTVSGSEGTASRLFRRGPHYVGAVHEVLAMPSGLRPLSVAVPREYLLIGHTGYDPSRIQGKIERNAQILQTAHETGHDIPLQHYNMGKTLMIQGKFREAREEILLSRKTEAPPANFRAEIFRTWYNASQALGDQAAMAEAVAAMREEMPNMPDSYAIEGVALWNEERQEEAAPLLERALELTRDFVQLNPGEMNVVSQDMPAVAEALIGFYQQRGEGERAEKIKNILTALSKITYN